MRTVRYHEHGGPSVLQVEEAPEPAARDDQVIVRAEAIGTNVIDAAFRSGTSPWPRPLPGALTGDVVGRVVKAAGEFQIGDRVAGLSEDAAADLVALDTDWLTRVPESAEAATATVLSMTAPLALGLLRAGRLAAGETVLVQSAAGGIGHLLVQLAARLGAKRIIGTASTEAKRHFVRGLGAEAAAYDAVEGPVDLVLDAVGGEVFDAGLIAAGEITPVIAERVPLADAARAHEILDARANLGRVVLIP